MYLRKTGFNRFSDYVKCFCRLTEKQTNIPQTYIQGKNYMPQDLSISGHKRRLLKTLEEWE